MAKRFTDTGKWKKGFIKGLPMEYKLFWFYILDDCDHAGIWDADFDIASIRVGATIVEEKAVELFAERFIKIKEGKYFIPDFISFQYGELNEKNRAHQSVLNILENNKINVNKPLISPLQGAMDKDKEMDKDKAKEGEKKIDPVPFKPPEPPEKLWADPTDPELTMVQEYLLKSPAAGKPAAGMLRGLWDNFKLEFETHFHLSRKDVIIHFCRSLALKDWSKKTAAAECENVNRANNYLEHLKKNGQ